MKRNGNRDNKKLVVLMVVLAGMLVLVSLIPGLTTPPVVESHPQSADVSSPQSAAESLIPSLGESSVDSDILLESEDDTDSLPSPSQEDSLTETSDREPEQDESEAPEVTEKKLIVIDAGHQAKGNYEKEPVGPGSTEMKNKVTGGTTGVVTGLAEYKLNLMVAEKLQQILEGRGYETVMIRTIHDVNISNAERAQIANELGADAFIRIHANGSDNKQTNGILTICQTENNPYNSEFYEYSYLLSKLVLDEMIAETGARRLYVWETDTMSGINWCMVPVTIVEMGFMSNEEEDRKMATDAYQELLALGIANGIDRYFHSIA